jgi:hypothetical protein
VDFNHPLAGKALKYKVRVVRQITDTLEKARSLLDYYGIKCETSLDGDTLSLETEKPMSEFLRKFVSESLIKWIPEVKNVVFGDKESKKEKSKPPEEQKKA